MRSYQSGRRRKPGLPALRILFVGMGIALTSLAQAEGQRQVLDLDLTTGMVTRVPSSEVPAPAWSQKLDLDMSTKSPRWKSAGNVFSSGLSVARPFGERGMALKLSTSVPRETRDSLYASGELRQGQSMNRSNAYLFVQKRW